MSLGSVEAPKYIYDLNHFNDVMLNGFNYELPNYTLELVSTIASQVGAPTYIRTPVFEKKWRKKKNNTMNDDDWETIRNFQSVEIKEGKPLEKLKNEIFGTINKMTKNTYKEQKIILISNIQKIIENDDYYYIPLTDDYQEVKQREIEEIYDKIINLLIYNSFNVEIYTDLLDQLTDIFDKMEDKFLAILNDYSKQYDNIEFMNSSENYDKFCAINLDNERRCAFTKFIVELTNKNLSLIHI